MTRPYNINTATNLLYGDVPLMQIDRVDETVPTQLAQIISYSYTVTKMFMQVVFVN